MSLLKSQAYIDGEWVDAVSKATFHVKNPANGEIVGTVPNMDAEDAEKAILAAYKAFTGWQHHTGINSPHPLAKWFELILENAEKLMEILRSETGKPLEEASMELQMALMNVATFVNKNDKMLYDKVMDIPHKKAYVQRQPLGAFGLIMPWNYPLALSVKKMVTALAAGCTCVLKPAEDTPLTVLAVVELAHQAGFRKGVVNVITSDRRNASAVGKVLCSSPLIAGISFTGSTQVGKIIYEQCAPHIRKLFVEQGGNIPFLVFNSANIDKAVRYGIRSTFLSCAEICPASYIFLVQEDVHDQFVEKFSEAMKNIEAGVTMGPLINKTQFQRLCSMVDDAKSKGGNIVVGGRPATKLGELFYEPTLITNVTKDMQVFRDEVIGPVASVMKFKTEGEGIVLVNDTKTKSVYSFTEEIGQIYRIRRLVQAPKTRVNDAYTKNRYPAYFRHKENCYISKDSAFYDVHKYCYLD